MSIYRYLLLSRRDDEMM